MRQRSNGLHFNGVAILQWVIQNSRSVDDLPFHVLVVRVSNKQGFGGEGVRLNFNISSGDLVDETGFSHVGKSTNDDCSGVGINAWQTAQMLSDLLQISQTLSLSFHYGGHTSQGSPFELLAPVKWKEKLFNPLNR